MDDLIQAFLNAPPMTQLVVIIWVIMVFSLLIDTTRF